MIRSATAASAAVACLLMAGGCRSTGWYSPLAVFKAPAEQTETLTAEAADSAAGGKADSTPSAAADPPPVETVAEVEKPEKTEENPFRRRPFRHLEKLMARGKTEPAEEATPSAPADSPVVAHRDSSSSSDRDPVWSEGAADASRGDSPFIDPVLQVQIDEELRYTDERDREDLRRTLTGLDPSMARQIIRVRQMARSMGQQQPQVARMDQPSSDGHPPVGTSQGMLDRQLFGHSVDGRDSFAPASSMSMPSDSSRRLLAVEQHEQRLPTTAALTNDPTAPGGLESNEVLRLASGARDSGYEGSARPYTGRRDARPVSRSDFAEPARNDFRTDTRQIASASRRSDQYRTAARGYIPDDLQRSPFDRGGSSNDRQMSSGFPGSDRGTAGLREASRFDSDLQRLISLAEAEAGQTRIGTTVEERQRYIEKQVYLRMLYLMGGRTNFALEPIHGLDAAHQEFWTQLLWSMANYFDDRNMPNEVDRVTQAVAQLKPAVRALQAEADLEVRNVAFCHRISSFGNYSRFPADEFSPGQKVLVYGEVANFLSEPTADGQYRTVLRSQIEILRPGLRGGAVAEPIRFAPTEDLCRNHRQDYFHSYEFTIPRDLPYGPHVMKLTIYDELSRKVATSSVNFTVR